MPKIAVHQDPLNTPSPYIPILSPVVSSKQDFVTVTESEVKKLVLLVGDVAASHAAGSNVHGAAQMDEKENFFFTISGIPVIINGDPADCLATHTIIASGFVEVTP